MEWISELTMHLLLLLVFFKYNFNSGGHYCIFESEEIQHGECIMWKDLGNVNWSIFLSWTLMGTVELFWNKQNSKCFFVIPVEVLFFQNAAPLPRCLISPSACDWIIHAPFVKSKWMKHEGKWRDCFALAIVSKVSSDVAPGSQHLHFTRSNSGANTLMKGEREREREEKKR